MCKLDTLAPEARLKEGGVRLSTTSSEDMIEAVIYICLEGFQCSCVRMESMAEAHIQPGVRSDPTWPLVYNGPVELSLRTLSISPKIDSILEP